MQRLSKKLFDLVSDLVIRIEITPPCGTIILNRPSKCNAVDRQMVLDLQQALDDLRQEKRIRVIILAGSGNHFCAGVDLAQWNDTQASPNALADWFLDTDSMRSLIEQMLQSPKPIIAAVDGAAVGFGLSLVLASDLVVASQKSVFSIPATRYGIVSGITAPLLVFRHGSSLATRLMIGGESLDALQAQNVGLVHHVVSSDQVWVRSQSWGQSIAQGPAEAIQLSKKVINEMVGEQLSALLSSGAAATATSLTTEVAAEGLRAFVEKRSPSYP